MTKQQAKTAVKETAHKLKKDLLTWAITIEMVVSQIFGYWDLLLPWLGVMAPYIQLGLIVIRVLVVGYKFYRSSDIKIGGTE